MRRRRWIPAFAAMTVAACSEPVAPVSGEYPTIVSLNPCADAILAEVAAPGQLLAISHYSHDPLGSSMPLDQARAYRITGGTVEEVLALDPDVVVTGTFLPPATRNAFERLGMQVVTLGAAQDVASSIEQVRALALAVDRAEQGEQMASRIEQGWEVSAFEGDKVETLFWQADGVVAGPDSLIARMLDYTGFASHSAAQGLGQGAYLPLERVLADPPELVIAAADQRMLAHPVLRQQADIAYAAFEPSLLFCGGPSIPRALERLKQIRERVDPPLPFAGGAEGGPVTTRVELPTPQPPPASGRGR